MSVKVVGSKGLRKGEMGHLVLSGPVSVKLKGAGGWI